MNENEQALPHSVEAERSVLGAILVKPDLINHAVGEAGGGLTAAHFYRNGHQRIFSAMLALFEKGIAIDPVTVKDRLETDGMLTEAGGLEYLMQLMDGMPRLDNLGAYSGIVRDKALQRSLYQAGQEISRAALAGEEDSSGLLNDAEKKIFEAGGAHLTRDYRALPEIGKGLEELLQRVRSGEPLGGGVPTGFTELDRLTTGLHQGQLWVVAARPGVGKSSFALSIAMNVARSGHGVLIFSLEMTSEELYQRMLCSEGRFDMQQFRKSQLSHAQRDSLLEVRESLEALPIHVDDGAGTTHPLMRAKARRLAKDMEAKGQKLDLIIVDYLQIMGSSSRRPENRAVEIGEMSKGLKEMAKELRVPVLTLAQLNRAPEKRGPNEPPQLSDLRESGSIEQDADLVAFLQRNFQADTPEERNETTVYIAKQRNGPVDKIKLAFLANMTMFADIQPNEVY